MQTRRASCFRPLKTCYLNVFFVQREKMRIRFAISILLTTKRARKNSLPKRLFKVFAMSTKRIFKWENAIFFYFDEHNKCQWNFVDLSIETH